MVVAVFAGVVAAALPVVVPVVAFPVAAVFVNFAAVFADAVNITDVTAASALVIPVAIVYCRTSHSCHSYCCGCFLVATAAAAAVVAAAAATMAILLDDDGATTTAVGVAVSTTVFLSQRLLLYDIVNQLPNF
jgi:hypothetical protein